MPDIQKIGLLGGTFDPVHLGHLIVAESVLNELKLDRIFFIPAHKHALKSNEKITSPNIRLKMLQMALQEFPYFSVSDIELQSENISFTIETLTSINLYENLSNAELYYIIGYDNLNELHLWKDYKKIIELVHLVVVGRTGTFDKNIIENFKDKLIFPETPQIDISSTLIRNKIKENSSWKSMVTPAVYQFIVQQNLYK